MSDTPKPPDYQTELAKERNRIAADRTLLSWIRVTVSFIGIGFGLDRVLATLDTYTEARLAFLLDIRTLGLFYIGLGIVTSLVAALDYQGELSRFQKREYRYTPRPSLGMFVAGALVVLSSIGLVIIWPSS